MSPTPHPSGHLIVFEGIDGSGKSTQARLLAEALQRAGHTVHLSQEPTQGHWGRLARESGTSGRLSPAEELDLFHRDRAEHVATLIAPALARGETVVLDRYYFSTMAYQGARGFDPAELRRINETFAPVPELVFVFDLPVETALGRIGARGAATAFEQQSALQRCREIFRALESEPFAHLIDAAQPPEVLHRTVLALLAEHCPELATASTTALKSVDSAGSAE